jgi:hypothetical protein
MLYMVTNEHEPNASAAERERVERRAKDWALIGGTMWRVGRGGQSDVAVPRPGDREDVVTTLHYQAGHQGRDAVLARLTMERYWWPRMRETVESVLARCNLCQRAEARRRPEHEGARTWEVAEPGQRWAMDLLSLPQTAEGWVGVAVLVDVVTKYPVAEPIRDKSVAEVLRVLKQVMALFGSFRELQTDNGPEFCAVLAQQFCQNTGMKRVVVTPFHPQANGQVERANRMLLEVLRRLSVSRPAEWPQYLPMTLHAIRSRRCSVTGFSPFRLMFGRDSTIMGEWDGAEPAMATDVERVLSRAEALVQLTSVTLPQARANTRRAQEKQRRRQNRRYVIVPPLEPGTQVFVEVGYFGQALKEKLADRYSGPYRVVRRMPCGNYVLMTREGRELPRGVPRDRMKRGRLGTDLSAEELRGAELRSSQAEVEADQAGAGEADRAEDVPEEPAGAEAAVETDPDVYEFEQVLAARRTHDGTWEYLVQWAGVAEDDPDRRQWVLEDDFSDPSAVRGYRRLGDARDDIAASASQHARRAGAPA